MSRRKFAKPLDLSTRASSGALASVPRAALFATLVVFALAAGACTTFVDEADVEGVAPVAIDDAREPLPEIAPGERLEAVERLLSGWPPAHRYTSDGVQPQGWEWSGPDGMRVEALVSGGVLTSVRTSRTWGRGAPPREGRLRTGLATGVRLDSLFRAVGPGLLVERVHSTSSGGIAGPLVAETWKWRIADRGLDTGLFLTVHARDGVVGSIRHRWSRR